LEELTDSEEEEMALSQDEEEHRRVKRARVDTPDSDLGATAPKWSNPDPYTSLPPVGEVNVKRTDVVKLIRKARIDGTAGSGKATNAADFISFEADDPESHSEIEESLSHQMGRPKSSHSLASRRSAEVEEGPVLGKRKRGETVGRRGQEPHLDSGVYSDSRVRQEWLGVGGTSSTPWLTSKGSTDIPGVA
jgi:non-canonical poly(A) RNA polymerase PAPD5/7